MILPAPPRIQDTLLLNKTLERLIYLLVDWMIDCSSVSFSKPALYKDAVVLRLALNGFNFSIINVYGLYLNPYFGKFEQRNFFSHCFSACLSVCISVCLSAKNMSACLFVSGSFFILYLSLFSFLPIILSFLFLHIFPATVSPLYLTLSLSLYLSPYLSPSLPPLLFSSLLNLPKPHIISLHLFDLELGLVADCLLTETESIDGDRFVIKLLR